MLTSDQEASPSAPPGDTTGRRPRRGSPRLRLLAAVLGVTGTVLALLFPFLPVAQDTATVTWPSPTTGTRSVDAPLVEFRPQTMNVDIPCSAVRSLDARSTQPATVVSTTPPLSPQGSRVGLQVTVANGQLTMTDRGIQAASGPVGPGNCSVRVRSDGAQTVANLGSGQDVLLTGDFRPQVVGVYSDLDGARDPVAGAAVSIVSDTRFNTSPTVLKVVAGVLAALCFAGSVWALHALDIRAGRRAPRWTPRRWWRPTGRDAVVVATLAVWSVIGSQTSDDGFIIGMAKARPSAGYIDDYYRWFNVPEAPFGWFYEFYALWVQVSDAVLWMRLPSLLMGIASWLLISRELLPRLGQRLRRSAAVGWAGGMVFLMFWLPYNNGLRPEPVAVIAALIAYCAVERAVATRRLAPVAWALVGAAFSLAATPTGLMAVAPFLAAVRPLFRLIQQRVRAAGLLPVLAPILASGLIVLVAIFADQTFAAVEEASRVRFLIGPDYAWYDELLRYQSLFSASEDGSLARRAPIMLLILGLVTCLTVLLRRDRIRGAAIGPSQRLLGSTLLGFLVLGFTPTKWTHHFGAFAALGSGVAALTALATSSEVLRSRRNRSLFLSGVFATLALAFTGPNRWWYTNGWGVPWFDKPPSYHGYQLSSFMIVIAVVLVIVAAVEHIRGIPEHRRARPDGASALGPRVDALTRRPRAVAGRLRRTPAASAVERRARALRLGSAPIAVLAGLLVLFEVASMAKGIQKQEGSFSLGGDVISHPFGGSCGLADHVMLEADPLTGLLARSPTPTGMAPAAPGVLPIVAPPTPVPDPRPLPPGVIPASDPQAQLIDPTPFDAGFRHDGGVPPTGGGTGTSRNEYTLRNNLAPQTLGSFDPSGNGTGVLRTDWYGLNDEVRSGRTPLVLTVAGRLNSGNSLTVQYAKHLPDGRVQVLSSEAVDDGASGVEPSWREIKLNVAGSKGAQADEVRLVAQDRSLGPDGWLAVAPLRAPKLAPMTDLVGHGTPMYLEWPVQFASPCLRPLDVHDGIAEVPQYRMTADDGQLRMGGDTWSSGSVGGPRGWVSVLGREVDVPSYLQGEPGRDWGRLIALQPYAPGAVSPTVQHGTRRVWGWTQEGEIGAPPPDPPTPDS